jgi:hypothetical protein
MTRSARAFWVTAPSSGEIREERLEPVGRGQVLVQTLYTAVSRGTEGLVFAGRVPVSEYRRMRAPHQGGEFPAPVKYGYANIGRVLEGAEQLRGRTVFALYPHQTAYVADESAVFPLPDGVPPARGVLAANLETCVNALWDARPLLGDRVSVVGAGVIGCLCAYLAQRFIGIEVELVDVRAERRTVAAALGIHFATPEAARRERDLVFHASATASGLETALSLAIQDGTVIELSWFGAGEVAVPLGSAFHARRLTLRSSQVGTVSPNARPRWRHANRLELALALCRDPALDVLFSEEGEFEALPDTMRRLATPAADVLCHRVHYPASGDA